MKFSFVLAVLSCAVYAGCVAAQSEQKSVSAPPSKDVSEVDFKALLEEISPVASEEKWRQTAWIPGIWEGITLAQEKKKPIFLWAMNGDPLGCV